MIDFSVIPMYLELILKNDKIDLIIKAFWLFRFVAIDDLYIRGLIIRHSFDPLTEGRTEQMLKYDSNVFGADDVAYNNEKRWKLYLKWCYVLS